ncbi:ATP-binding cassette domain-containing protein [Bacillus sp. FJAT-49732]|uniref:ATP-binding cassette domain-containing protein n=1 Tax=Lederbergia citrisecunda TaxID=2833583 RepID=A0A942THQ4_9BACI|nr:ATP-binding cassette domain-containing protein [Lederbergia citrisecunda]MBS4198240.1 ATP-binding cassette domain-containing protein [Lederbergia citrisecunda]
MRIALHDVEYSLPETKLLKSITCSFTKGITYVVGKNGAGKSTLLKLLTTAIQPVHGEVNYTRLVRDEQLGTYRKKLSIEEIRKIIGFLPQHFTGHSDMTVEKYITYIAYHKGIPRKLVKKSVENWLKESHLTHVKRRKIRHLSGGERQKVGLIQALINLPRICILDEPFEGLDIEERLYFQRILQRLSYHSIIIISTHLIDEIRQSSEDKILYLSEGKIAYFGGIESLDTVTQRLEEA